MRPDQAHCILELNANASPDAIKAAFKKQSRILTGFNAGEECIWTMEQLKAARDFMLANSNAETHVPTPKRACQVCHGHGIIALGLRQTICSHCNGTGEAR